MSELTELREKIRGLDEKILRLVAERLDVARRIGQAKIDQNLPVKDYKVEKAVIERARAIAASIGLDPDFSEEIQQSLIKFACNVQEETKGRAVADSPSRARRRILLVGGQGAMGRWFAGYFEAFGHDVTLYDIVKPALAAPFPIAADLEAGAREADVIVLCTPIERTGEAIERLTHSGTKALVFDICSLKSPFLEHFRKAESAGLKIVSIHPMFGPGVKWLNGRKILLLDGAHPAYTDEAKTLFEESSAELIRLGIDRHDELVGRILGLSHLVSLLFAGTLAARGPGFSELRGVGSTTFDAQVGVSGAVVRESPDLYFAIQALNLHSPELLGLFEEQLSAFSAAIRGKDRAGFRELMEKGRRYFEEKP